MCFRFLLWYRCNISVWRYSWRLSKQSYFFCIVATLLGRDMDTVLTLLWLVPTLHHTTNWRKNKRNLVSNRNRDHGGAGHIGLLKCVLLCCWVPEQMTLQCINRSNFHRAAYTKSLTKKTALNVTEATEAIVAQNL